jgi:hypothetical protein
MPSKRDAWFTCPVCGERVRAGALACPGCGSDDRTGWSPDTAYDGLDLPDPEEDAAVAWSEEGERRPSKTPAWIWITAAVLLAVFLLFALRGWV